MNTITNITEANILLEEYIGAKAQIWIFQVTHKRLLLKLSLSNLDKVVYIVAVTCEHMTGPFSWKNANVKVTLSTDRNTSENVTKISDAGNKFELITSGGFALAYGKDIEFGDSFENFIPRDY